MKKTSFKDSLKHFHLAGNSSPSASSLKSAYRAYPVNDNDKTTKKNR